MPSFARTPILRLPLWHRCSSTTGAPVWEATLWTSSPRDLGAAPVRLHARSISARDSRSRPQRFSSAPTFDCIAVGLGGGACARGGARAFSRHVAEPRKPGRGRGDARKRAGAMCVPLPGSVRAKRPLPRLRLPRRRPQPRAPSEGRSEFQCRCGRRHLREKATGAGVLCGGRASEGQPSLVQGRREVWRARHPVEKGRSELGCRRCSTLLAPSLLAKPTLQVPARAGPWAGTRRIGFATKVGASRPNLGPLLDDPNTIFILLISP